MMVFTKKKKKIFFGHDAMVWLWYLDTAMYICVPCKYHAVSCKSEL